ncbi:tyrosine decarboxylase-like [Lycorma delicatula]|uniref:tyrosine decarboxylase-like n=1 Tax=Lycorma delicatula TaxID=130591 RepID=UPI003F50D992
MDEEEFKRFGKQIIDYMVEYRNTVSNKKVTPPDIKPHYLRPLLPSEAPMNPEKFEDIMKDFDTKVMEGMVHWLHPHFFSYLSSGDSYSSIIGDMLSDGIACVGFAWASCPACSELEVIMMDWIAKAFGLPEKFLCTSKNGSGALEGSASDAIMVVLLAARYNALEALKDEFHFKDEDKVKLLPKLVAYCSTESHSCVEKAAKLNLVKLRILPVNNEGYLEPEVLDKAMEEDEQKGLKPFFYSAILGSTKQGAFDRLNLLGPVIRKRPDYFWFHCDAAYAGNAFICPEMRPLMEGIEYVNSINVNPNKWLLTVFDASLLWVDDQMKLIKGMIVDPLYIHYLDTKFVDRRHWTIALSRRFRALKLWFLFRLHGISGLQKYIREDIEKARHFENLVREDKRFQVHNIVRCGIICFQLGNDDNLTQNLLTKLNVTHDIFLAPTTFKNKYCTVWKEIQKKATEVLVEAGVEPEPPMQSDSLTVRVPPEHFEKLNLHLADVAQVIIPDNH